MEWAAIIKDPVEEVATLKAALDTDGDGKITKNEFLANGSRCVPVHRARDHPISTKVFSNQCTGPQHTQSPLREATRKRCSGDGCGTGLHHHVAENSSGYRYPLLRDIIFRNNTRAFSVGIMPPYTHGDTRHTCAIARAYMCHRVGIVM